MAQAEVGDEGAVALDVSPLEVAQQAAALADHHQQPAAGMVILGMGLKMLGQVLDPVGQEGNLHLAGTGIGLMDFELFNNFLFSLCCLRHAEPPVVLLLPAKPFPSASLESGYVAWSCLLQRVEAGSGRLRLYTAFGGDQAR